jgi:hypothetical protein
MGLSEVEIVAGNLTSPTPRHPLEVELSPSARGSQAAPYLMSVRSAAEYLGRTEKAVRHMYERRVLTPLRIDGRVFLDRREIDSLYERARAAAV